MTRKRPTVLVTGFEPFDGDRVNPSWEVASRLEGWQVRDGHGTAIATVRAARLPCVFGEALATLEAALARHRPVAVLALGLAASRPDISIERVAINIDDARIPDNRGQQPVDRPVCADAPVAYWSTLPIKAILASLHQAGIAASVSQSAGTYVCNHVFYGLAHRLATQPLLGDTTPGGHGIRGGYRKGVRSGFIHVPRLAQDGGVIDLETMITAIRIAVRVTLTFGEGDLVLAAGAID